VKNKSTSRLARFNAAAFVAGMLLVSGVASAKDHKAKTADQQARVVAHISFEGLSGVDMAMQKKVNDKYYLYVQHARDQGVSIIDISNPAEPKLVGAKPWPDPALSSRMNVTGNLAIIAETEQPAGRNRSTDDLVFWDLSNPAEPHVVQKFTGVVRWLQDERDFIYVLNGDGLWVVAKPEETPKQAESSDSYGG